MVFPAVGRELVPLHWSSKGKVFSEASSHGWLLFSNDGRATDPLSSVEEPSSPHPRYYRPPTVFVLLEGICPPLGWPSPWVEILWPFTPMENFAAYPSWLSTKTSNSNSLRRPIWRWSDWTNLWGESINYINILNIKNYCLYYNKVHGLHSTYLPLEHQQPHGFAPGAQELCCRLGTWWDRHRQHWSIQGYWP